MTSQPLYPFGYGLSYTNFNYSEVKLSKKQISANETLEISVDITNDGDFDGDEVVQMYITVPDKAGDQPRWSLKGFKRIFLEKGATGKVSFILGKDEMEQFARDGTSSVKSGDYTVYIGGS